MSALEIGRLLDEAKVIMKDGGKWKEWIQAEFHFSADSANAYIRTYHKFKDFDLTFPITSSFTLVALNTASEEKLDDLIKQLQRHYEDTGKAISVVLKSE